MSDLTVRNGKDLTLLTPSLVTRKGESTQKRQNSLAQNLLSHMSEGENE
jgi:hypothetical protein